MKARVRVPEKFEETVIDKIVISLSRKTVNILAIDRVRYNLTEEEYLWLSDLAARKLSENNDIQDVVIEPFRVVEKEKKEPKIDAIEE